MSAMPEMRLELNLLKVARVLTVYWLVSWASIPLYFIVTTGGDTVLSSPHLAVLIGISAVVLILLVWTPAQQRLGRAFFPLVITLSSLPFLIER